MKAVVLAAGEGTRLRDVTDGEIPKPMVEADGKPVLEYTLDKLVEFGVEEIIINLHYEGEVIENYFGHEWEGTSITYSWEEELLGTAGGVKKVEEKFNETFLVVYGDVVTDIDLESFLELHKKKNGLGTLLVYNETENLGESSILFLDQENRIQKFIEKPSTETIKKNQDREFFTNAAIYFLETETFDYIENGFQDFSKDVFPKIIDSENNIYGYKLPKNAYWHEIGNPKRYKKLKQDIRKDNVDW